MRSVANPSTKADRATTDEAGRNLFNATRTIDQTSENGGVIATTMLANPSSVQQFDPSAPDADEEGLVNRPNVALESEVAEQITAQRQFEANLATVRADELLESTLDIVS